MSKKPLFITIIGVLLLIAKQLLAAEYGTADEAKALLERAVAAVKADGPKALADFSAGANGFRDRDLYVFCYGPDARISAHPNPEALGKSVHDLPNGKLAAEEMLRVAQEGAFSEVTSLDANGRPLPAPAAATPGLDASGHPIQAPIAETLRTQRKVQVYINFVTDKADLQPSSAPVLNELLATLNESADLKIDLIGHTDAAGSDAHNQELSKRRAATVYLWLVQHGIARERLHSDGRGFLELIATNDTDAGRALNRRVEVKALN